MRAMAIVVIVVLLGSCTSTLNRGVGGLAPRESALADHGRRLLEQGEIGRAVTVLQSAVEASPDDADAWNDLASALLVRSTREDRPEDLLEALSAVEAASRLVEDHAGARANRRWVLDRLFVHAEFPDERFEGIAAMFERAARGGRGSVARFVADERVHLDRWLEWRVMRPLAAGESITAASLETARRIGDALADHAADRSARDGLDRLTADDRAATKRRTAISRWFESVDHRGADETRLEEEEARFVVEACPPPCAPFTTEARLRLAIADYRRFDSEAAGRALDAARAEAATLGYASLSGRTQWMYGLIAYGESRLTDAIDHYSQAVDQLRQAREPGRVAELLVRLSEIHRDLGKPLEAWYACDRGFAGLSKVPSSRSRQQALMSCARSAVELGYPHAALPLVDTAVELANRGERPMEIAQGLILRARRYLAVGERETALRDARRADGVLESIPDGSHREQLAEELHVTLGFALRATDPATAADHLDRAIDRFEQNDRDQRLFELYLERGRARAALGFGSDAEDDFLAGIESYERHRRAISGLDRISYFDRARDLFDAVIRLSAERSSAEHGWSLVERSRGRELLDRLSGDENAIPSSPDALRSGLPPATTLVSYAVLDDRLLAWTLTREGIELLVVEVGASRLNTLVARLLDSVRRRHRTVGSAARELHELLIAPLPLDPSTRSLVVVPDGALHRLPFALLEDASNRPLVESFAISVTPSAAVLFNAIRRSGDVTRPRALVIGDPAFAAEAFPNLPRLRGARREARAVANLYPEADLLTEADATPARFAELATGADVIHVAGHAVNDDRYPERSRLALARDETHDGQLTAGDLQQLDLSHVRLVVLAACSTASGRVSSGEGALSLARALLAAGTPATLASLWNIDDEASTAFAESFHRHWLAGAAVDQAVRAAQLELAGSGRPELSSPAVWAAFQLVGSPTVRVRTTAQQARLE